MPVPWSIWDIINSLAWSSWWWFQDHSKTWGQTATTSPNLTDSNGKDKKGTSREMLVFHGEL